MVLVAIIVHGESLTFDEGDHIFAGYMMWHTGDYGLNPEHPPLVKLVATVPLLRKKLWVPPLQQRMFKTEAYRDGRIFWNVMMAQSIACSSACGWWLVFLRSGFP